MPTDRHYTTHEVALLIQVDASTVSKWVDKGTLLAFRTPGGHRRVRASDLIAFLNQYRMPVPRELGGTGEVPAQSGMIVIRQPLTKKSMRAAHVAKARR